MAYIGNKLADAYTSFAKQDFTTSVTTSYTLDNPVANENEIALFINFVRQEPTTAYTASGVNLTLTSATSASDDMYCVFLGKALQTVNPPAGSVGTSQLNSSLDFSSKTITLASNMKMTPAFFARATSVQSIPSRTYTKVEIGNEIFDEGNVYDSTTNYRFTPAVAGKYFITSNIAFGGIDSGEFIINAIYKNGSITGYSDSQARRTLEFYGTGSILSVSNSFIDTANTTDYYEFFTYQDDTDANNTNITYGVWFGAYKIIE